MLQNVLDAFLLQTVLLKAEEEGVNAVLQPRLPSISFLSVLLDRIDIQHCISCGVQNNDLTHIHHEMMITVSVLNIYHLTQIQK